MESEYIINLLKKVKDHIATGNYNPRDHVFYAKDPNYLVVAFCVRSNRRHFLVIEKSSTYKTNGRFELEEMPVYGCYFKILKDPIDLFKVSNDWKYTLKVAGGPNITHSRWSGFLDYVNTYSIKDIDEVYDKLVNAKFHEPYRWFRNIKDSQSSSLKGIFGVKEFRIMRLVNELGTPDAPAVAYLGCNLNSDMYQSLMRDLDNADIINTLHNMVKAEQKAHLMRPYEIFSVYTEVSKYLNQQQLLKYLKFYIKHCQLPAKNDWRRSSYCRVWRPDIYRDYLAIRQRLAPIYDIRKLPVLINNFEGSEYQLTKALEEKHEFVWNFYSDHREELEQEKLRYRQESYSKNVYALAKSFEFESDDYIIKAPQNLNELIDEGKALSHCVGSYTESVSEGREYILFLRKKSDPDKSFFTIDVNTDLKVRQIHGMCNCNVPKELLPIIEKWAEEKKVDVSNTSGIFCALNV